MNQEQLNNDPILERIIGRCHVADSYESVIEYAQSRLAKNAWNKINIKDQERFRKACIHLHNKNRKFYNFVMGPH